MDDRLVALGLALLATALLLWVYAPKLEVSAPAQPGPVKPLKPGSPSFELMINHTYRITARIMLRNRLNRTVNDYVYLVIPRNTSFQKCYVLDIKPKPLRVQRDEDGNVFAVFAIRARPGEKVWISADFRVIASEYKINKSSAVPLWPPLSIVERYTIATAMWDTKNSTLRRIAYSAGKGDNPLEIAESLAKWMVSHLEYRVINVRLGADRAIREVFGKPVVVGDCVEVADVYVTLARVMGIPARTAYGFMLSKPNEVMWLNFSARESGESLLEHWGGHMWPEIYVPPWGWIDVEMLEGLKPKVGDYSWRHILLGVEETKYYGTTLSNFCVSGFLRVEYAEYRFTSEG